MSFSISLVLLTLVPFLITGWEESAFTTCARIYEDSSFKGQSIEIRSEERILDFSTLYHQGWKQSTKVSAKVSTSCKLSLYKEPYFGNPEDSHVVDEDFEEIEIHSNAD